MSLLWCYRDSRIFNRGGLIMKCFIYDIECNLTDMEGHCTTSENHCPFAEDGEDIIVDAIIEEDELSEPDYDQMLKEKKEND